MAKKYVMAWSGVLFVLFILMHMYGNMKMFLGAEAFDGYAEWLRDPLPHLIPANWFLYLFRVLLLAALLIHLDAAFSLWLRAKKARGTPYVVQNRLATTYAVRTMRWGGVIILVFLAFHLLQFTTLSIEIGGDYHAMSPYERMVVAFQPANWWLYLIYLVAVSALAFHIRHGVWSLFATFGAAKKRRQHWINVLAIVVALVVIIGFMAAPTAIMFGFIS